MTQTFKIDRLSDEENTTAIISFTGEERLTVQETLNLVTTAVTKWIQKTKEGKKAWEYSCGDFNIGDLASYIEDDDLIKYFDEVGLTNVKLIDNEYESSKYIWNFDTVLGDTSELEYID